MRKVKNIISITLNLNEIGLKRFKTVPTFSNLLHYNQLQSLKIGDNYLQVNHTAYGSLVRMVGCDADNMNLIKN